ASRSEGGTADHVERKSRFHAQHRRSIVVKGETQERRDAESEQRDRETRPGQRSVSDRFIESDPQENAGVSGCRVRVPGCPGRTGAGKSLRNVVRQHRNTILDGGIAALWSPKGLPCHGSVSYH